jgi:phosphotransferase system HPr (HPr) family protein
MIQDTLEVECLSGLHARSARNLVQLVEEYEAEVLLRHDGVEAQAESIMELMMLAASPGTRIQVEIEGSDEDELHEELVDFFAEGFYENEQNV